MSIQQILLSLPLFGGIPNEILESLAARCSRRKLGPGEFLFREGEAGDDVYVVAEGAVRITKAVQLGVERTLAVLARCSMFGEAAIVDRDIRSASAVAEQDSELVVIPAEPMKEWLIANAGYGVRVLGRLGSMMLDRLRDTNELLREATRFGLEVAGASRLGIDQLLAHGGIVDVHLLTGRDLRGRLVDTRDGPAGQPEIWVKDGDGRVHVVPYHALASLAMPMGGPSAFGTEAGRN